MKICQYDGYSKYSSELILFDERTQETIWGYIIISDDRISFGKHKKLKFEILFLQDPNFMCILESKTPRGDKQELWRVYLHSINWF